MSTVLLVDDSPDDRTLFRHILGRAGFTVHEVARGGEALARAVEVRPHVVVLDVNLPDTDGFEVCRTFRADARFKTVPILMLTVRDRESDVIAGLDAGADDYVAKDEAPEIIQVRIRRLVRYSQMATASILNEQLAQVGRLLTGIVHEIRGPVSVIRGNAVLIKLQSDPADPVLEFVDPIIRNTQILQVRLEHLMTAVRGGPPVPAPASLIPLIRESADLFSKGIDPHRGRIALDVEPSDGCDPHVLADSGRLIQVFMNLFANARDAMLAVKTRGRIVVRIDLTTDEGREWARVRVVDDGPGIAKAHLDRIFEPFFSTKAEGSGYGLYLAAELIRQQSGRLTASNEPDGGACFAVWLPLAPSAVPS